MRRDGLPLILLSCRGLKIKGHIMGTLRMEDTESDVFADDVSDAALEISEGRQCGSPRPAGHLHIDKNPLYRCPFLRVKASGAESCSFIVRRAAANATAKTYDLIRHEKLPCLSACGRGICLAPPDSNLLGPATF